MKKIQDNIAVTQDNGDATGGLNSVAMTEIGNASAGDHSVLLTIIIVIIWGYLTKTNMQTTLQEKRQNVINKEIYCMANTLGEKLFYEYYEGSEYIIDIHNEYDPINNDDDGESLPKEIYQYFIVSPSFAEKAIKNGNYIIETQDLFIWGRECCGVSLTNTKELNFMFS